MMQPISEELQFLCGERLFRERFGYSDILQVMG
jgi:hypothetical protein